MRLFEFEVLEEGVAQVRKVKDIVVLISDHAFDRMKTRTAVSPEIFNELVKKIPYVKNKFKPLDDNMSFKIWSKSMNLGLGMRKYPDKDGWTRVLVATVLDKPLFDNVDDIVLYVG